MTSTERVLNEESEQVIDQTVLRNASGPDIERIKEKIIRFFMDNNLAITTETGHTQTDFLNVTIDRNHSTYWPYRKPNDTPLYINKKSNYPPAITKQLPDMISKRISRISCNEEQ